MPSGMWSRGLRVSSRNGGVQRPLRGPSRVLHSSERYTVIKIIMMYN